LTVNLATGPVNVAPKFDLPMKMGSAQDEVNPANINNDKSAVLFLK
jgi:hypothetical protein